MSGLDPDWEADWLAAVGQDAEFRTISRWTRVSLRLVGQDFDRSYRVERSAIGPDDRGTQAPTVTLSGSADAWAAYLTRIPRPPNHHVLAMARRRDDFTIDGRQALIQNLRVLNRVLDVMRVVASARHEEIA